MKLKSDSCVLLIICQNGSCSVYQAGENDQD